MLPMPPIPIPEPTVHETVAYYDVGGRVESDIVAELDAKGPGDEEARYWGRTNWSVGWDYGVRSEGGRCMIDRPRLWLNIVIILPRWTHPYGASTAVTSKWQRLSAALERHEREHVHHGQAALTAVVALMHEKGHDQDCTALRQRIEREGQALVNGFWQQDKVLDDRTSHGATEGVAIQW